METYSLVQLDLEQTIGRLAMEEASVAVPGIGKADCARMQRELFGILVGGLSRSDAEAFQSSLRARGFPTRVVADRTIPSLPPCRGFMRLETRGPEWSVEDALGRATPIPRESLVLVAGGFMKKKRPSRERSIEWETQSFSHDGGVRRQLVVKKVPKIRDAPSSRLELFTTRPPYRWQLILREQTVFFLDQEPLRLDKEPALQEAVGRLAGSLPPERINQGLRFLRETPPLSYPGVRAFEEEIRWRFFLLKEAAARAAES